MKGGFSFKGKDIYELGLLYTPEIKDTYVYKQGEYKVSSQVFDGHDGGYYYGATVQPKQFVLKCIFWKKHINFGVLSQIHQFFKRGTYGKLVFEKRPWLYYYGTVTKIDTTGLTNFENGIVTITITAYYPYGRTELKKLPEEPSKTVIKTNDDGTQEQVPNSEYEQELEAYYSALTNTQLMNFEPETTWTNSYYLDQPFYLYNAGTERAKLTIEILGGHENFLGDGFTITNSTTGQSMHLKNTSRTLPKGRYICDGITGKCMMQQIDKYDNEDDPYLSFLYHDYGFIELEPNHVSHRDITVTYERDSYNRACLTCPDDLSQDLIGEYIYYGNKWRRITDIVWNNHKEWIYVTPSLSNNGQQTTNICSLNKINFKSDVETDDPEYIFAVSDPREIEFKYEHTFS